jgi:hypothetical protein
MTAARTSPTGPAGADRAAYLREVCGLLWPAPAEAALVPGGRNGSARGGPADTELIVLPGIANPRLVVPSDRRASAVAVRRYGEPGSARTWLATRALSVVLGSGAGTVVLRDRLAVRVPPGAQTIESYLSSVLGRRVMLGMHLGAARANRKPVLQLLGADGDTIGYAKIGINDLTADLVRAERAALERLADAGLTGLEVPRVLDAGSWRGMEILVLSPLPVWRRRVPLRPGQLSQAMAELALVSGIQRSPLTSSGYWQRLAARLESAGNGAEQDAVRDALGQLEVRAGNAVLGFGACHGDWTQWNMANTRGGLLVWDWERFTVGPPVGFDPLHYWLQANAVGHRGDPRQAAAECVTRSARLLDPLGVPPDESHVTALLYLADLAVRYLSDRQEQAGARLGAPRLWLIPALSDGVTAL